MIVLYDMQLVGLSIAIAIIGSLTALAAASAPQWLDSDRLHKVFALANGALVQGSSIWSMHFIAMMAVQFPVLVNYSPPENVLSLLLAIFVTGAGLYVVGGHRTSPMYIPVAGLFMGLGIAGMHYLGMAAIIGCGIRYDSLGVALSIAIAVLASTAALWFTFTARGIVMTVLGGITMGLAIASMHYTAMFATHFAPLKEVVFLSEPLFSQNDLAYLIAAAMLFICTVTMIVLAIARFGRAGRIG